MACADLLANSPVFEASRLERVFNDCFGQACRTWLRGGADEPYYQPAPTGGDYHVLYFREDYFASALHEASHWCIAGDARRLQPDFGYWYTPETRSVDQQRAFERVESKPQGLEWIFSRACGFQFRPSADNLDLDRRGLLDSVAFSKCVLEEVHAWQSRGLPARADTFYRALCREFGTAVSLGALQFDLRELG